VNNVPLLVACFGVGCGSDHWLDVGSYLSAGWRKWRRLLSQALAAKALMRRAERYLRHCPSFEFHS
jgi:hypothetical protein